MVAEAAARNRPVKASIADMENQFVTAGKSAVKRRQVRSIPTASILDNPDQPRTHRDDATIADLAASIQRDGLMNPIHVGEVSKDGKTQYTLIAGSRRLAAYRMLAETDKGNDEWEHIPAFAVPVSRVDNMRMALIENTQREDLHPLDVGRTYEAYREAAGDTNEQVAKAFGKDPSEVSRSVGLLRLDESIQEEWIENPQSVTTSDMVELSKLEVPEQLEMWEIHKSDREAAKAAIAALKKARKKEDGVKRQGVGNLSPRQVVAIVSKIRERSVADRINPDRWPTDTLKKTLKETEASVGEGKRIVSKISAVLRERSAKIAKDAKAKKQAEEQ